MSGAAGTGCWGGGCWGGGFVLVPRGVNAQSSRFLSVVLKARKSTKEMTL